MLAKRIISCLDVDKGRVVKGINFVNIKDAGDPVELAKYYYKEGTDEIVFLDITASSEKRKIILDVVKRVAKEIFIPFTVGGGIKSINDIKEILKSGADKAAINTGAVEKPDLINNSANMFGSQCIVLAIDAKRKNGSWEVYINGGRTETGLDAVSWAKEGVRRGAGEILLTSMDRDGTKKGFDIELTKKVSRSVGVPVIASGGAGTLSDFADVLKHGEADAALAASLFHFGQLTITRVKRYLKKNKIPVRNEENKY